MSRLVQLPLIHCFTCEAYTTYIKARKVVVFNNYPDKMTRNLINGRTLMKPVITKKSIVEFIVTGNETILYSDPLFKESCCNGSDLMSLVPTKVRKR